MADIQTQLPIRITDGTQQVAIISGAPTSTASALATREVRVGQATMAASFPVTMASDQSSISVNLASTNIVQAVSGTVTVTQGNAGSVGQSWYTRITDGTNGPVVVSGNTPASSAAGLVVREAARGQSNMAGSMPVVIASDQSNVGVTFSNSTIAVTQSTASNLNATVTQGTAAANSGAWPIKITDGTNAISLVSGTPTSTAQAVPTREVARGQQTMANSIPVTIASNQTALSFTPGENASGNIAQYGTATVNNGNEGTLVTYTASGGTFYFKGIHASASGGPAKIVVDYGAGPTVVAVAFFSTAQPYVTINFPQPLDIADTTAVRVKMTNSTGQSMDGYAIIFGHQV